MMYFLFTLTTMLIACVASADAFNIEVAIASLPVLVAKGTSITLPASKWRFLLTNSVGKMAGKKNPSPVYANRLLFYNKNNLLYVASKFASAFFYTPIGQALQGLNGVLCLSIPNMKDALKGVNAKTTVSLNVHGEGGDLLVTMDTPDGASFVIDSIDCPLNEISNNFLDGATTFPTGLPAGDDSLLNAMRVGATLFAANDVLKPSMQNVCVELYPDEGWRVLATDAHKALEQKSSSTLNADSNKALNQLLLDAQTLKKLLGIKNIHQIWIPEYVQEEYAICIVTMKNGSDMICHIPLYDDMRFPKIDNFLSSNPVNEYTPSMTVNVEDWEVYLKPHVKKKSFRVLEIDPANAEAPAILKECGDKVAELPLKPLEMGSIPVERFGVNPLYLQETLQGFLELTNQEKATWHQGGPNAPIIFHPNEQMDCPIRLILMPIMLSVNY